MEIRCQHPEVRCLNEYDSIRKYRCLTCNEVMMCRCDEARGKKFLPHQLDKGCELETQKRWPVTLGFQPDICNECKGRPSPAFPMASIPGRTTKITRYYWRELSFLEFELFDQLEPEKEFEILDWLNAPKEISLKIRSAALAQIKALHASQPKYTYADESQEAIIRKYSVEVLNLRGEHTHREGEKRVFILNGEEAVSVEAFVAAHFERDGYQVLELESRPFHVLFGVFFASLIHDPDDSESRMEFFGERSSERSIPIDPALVGFFKPTDFGTPGYAVRRRAEIDTYMSELPDKREDWLWSFDYLLASSAALRNYLWAHREEDVSKARRLVEILSLDSLRAILKYLIEAYWNRYCGWPDLLIWRGEEIRFVEVKSSNDKLSDDQKNWIRGNAEHLGFRFSIAKLHRS
jgi:hypothetical protein